MAHKSKSKSRFTGGTPDPSQTVRDSAQKIWLAGLGAFERAKSDGPKMFETLVQQGRELGGKAREAADQAMRSAREQAGDAGGKWDKLEQVFEERVSRSLGRLGVLTARDVDDLSRQVKELNESVRNLMSKDAGAKRSTATRRKASGKAPAKKRATRKKPA